MFELATCHNSMVTRVMHLDQKPDKWEIGCPVALPMVISCTYQYQSELTQGVKTIKKVLIQYMNMLLLMLFSVYLSQEITSPLPIWNHIHRGSVSSPVLVTRNLNQRAFSRWSWSILFWGIKKY